MDAPQPDLNPADPTLNPADAPQGDADAPLNEGGMKALAAERLARRHAETALAQLREEVRTSEAAVLRNQVAAAHRLPPQLARRLMGTTREELEADALELAGALQPSTLKARPNEKLAPGAIPSAGEGFKPSKVVDDLLAR
jgi:hypothetical protein